MTEERKENRLCFSVPDSNYSVGASRSKPAPVRAESEAFYDARMADEPYATLAGTRVEDLDPISAIRRKSCNQTAVVIQDAAVEFMKRPFRAGNDVEYLRVRQHKNAAIV